MPKEVRRLVFSHAESTEAITNYGKKMNITFPKGKIIRAKFAGTAEYEFHTMRDVRLSLPQDYNVKEKRSAIIITFFDEETFEHKFFNLTADFVSGALIEYSINHKIMLPRNATKDLDITEFNICLDVIFDNYTSDSSPVLSIEED